MKLESFVLGAWRSGASEGVALRDATSGELIAHATTDGFDMAAILEHARTVGGPALRETSFHERAALLRALGKRLLESKEDFYALSHRTGATRADSWIDIDGGIGTMLAFASKGARELPDGRVYLDGGVEALSKGGSFVGRHVCVSRAGAAVQINAFNFPVWGMFEKLAPAILAGMPVIVKPATATAYLTERVVRRIVELAILPPGTLQMIAGGVGDLFDHLGSQDVVSFTGSASTAVKLRTHPIVTRRSVRFIAETDSLNSSILGPDAGPGTAEFELYADEVVREMTVKAGQKCTAIRKAIVPATMLEAATAAIAERLAAVRVGDPRAPDTRMGPLASRDQRHEVLHRLEELRGESDLIHGDPHDPRLREANARGGGFLAPLLLRCRDAASASAVHSVEAFGPVATLLAYRDLDEAIELARRGDGSLAGSLFTADEKVAAHVAIGLAPFHGRLLVVNRHCAAESTGHGAPLAPLVHGGPGRAGGGEEMGGIRGVLHYMQRTALQGSPAMLAAIGGRWIRGATERDPGRHPFRKPFDELAIGDTFRSNARQITVADIEAFAALTGDNFYAHMSETEAARNPLFGSRVAHGYYLISAAAGLFVDPDYGPVLGNYGLDELRFVKPAKPGDWIKVRLTCKEKSLRADKGWGEVRWDALITNQDGETVASYDVLTMVSVHAVPDAAR
ncbi:MAG: phenylacetic acid degradation bifunctional protein PaaZ [Steroidobacteraceae bacterium]|nr:phenylacetic acid degradation bifunctional protein PaaZ [Steroidobacteraceae bacterium]